MIVWINGTFGVGKTTTSRALLPLVPQSRIFDSEYVGMMLRHVLATEPVDDFQDWPPWRALVVETAAQVLGYVGGVLVVPQSVLVEDYWSELRTGLLTAGVPIRHFVLHADRDAITRRIDEDAIDPDARDWRVAHLDAYEKARDWLSREAETIDTTDISAGAAAHRIADRLRQR